MVRPRTRTVPIPSASGAGTNPSGSSSASRHAAAPAVITPSLPTCAALDGSAVPSMTSACHGRSGQARIARVQAVP